MSEFVEAFVHTTTDIYHFHEEVAFLKFLRTEEAKEITSICYTEIMSKEEYDKQHATPRP